MYVLNKNSMQYIEVNHLASEGFRVSLCSVKMKMKNGSPETKNAKDDDC